MPRGWERVRAAVSVLLAACGAGIGFAAIEGCGGDRGGGGGGSGFDISLVSMTPPAGGDLVWMVDAGGGADLQIVELLARDFTRPFDRFTLEICFDPLIVEFLRYTSADMLDACAGVPALKASEEIACSSTPGAQAILVTEAVTGLSPPSCSLSQTRSLGRITLRARGPGSSALTFVPFNGDPNNPEGSVFLDGHPNGVPLVIQFFDTGTSVEVSS